MNIKVARLWRLILRERGLNPSSNSLAQIELAAKTYGYNRVLYGLDIYRQLTLSPNWRDFVEWLVDSNIPEDLICAAYLTRDPEIAALANRLETLRGAWFPDNSALREIERLEERLKVLM